jgi:hypothetical protein
MKKLKYFSLFTLIGVSMLTLIGISLVLISIFSKGDLSGSGTAYFEVSPDSKYIVMCVYPDKDSYQMLMTPEKKVLFAKKVGRNEYAMSGAIWMNRDKDDVDNDYVATYYDSEIILPPSRFQQIYAWLFVSITRFNINNMVMKPLR